MDVNLSLNRRFRNKRIKFDGKTVWLKQSIKLDQQEIKKKRNRKDNIIKRENKGKQ